MNTLIQLFLMFQIFQKQSSQQDSLINIFHEQKTDPQSSSSSSGVFRKPNFDLPDIFSNSNTKDQQNDPNFLNEVQQFRNNELPMPDIFKDIEDPNFDLFKPQVQQDTLSQSNIQSNLQDETEKQQQFQDPQIIDDFNQNNNDKNLNLQALDDNQPLQTQSGQNGSQIFNDNNFEQFQFDRQKEQEMKNGQFLNILQNTNQENQTGNEIKNDQDIFTQNLNQDNNNFLIDNIFEPQDQQVQDIFGNQQLEIQENTNTQNEDKPQNNIDNTQDLFQNENENSQSIFNNQQQDPNDIFGNDNFNSSNIFGNQQQNNTEDKSLDNFFSEIPDQQDKQETFDENNFLQNDDSEVIAGDQEVQDISNNDSIDQPIFERQNDSENFFTQIDQQIGDIFDQQSDALFQKQNLQNVSDTQQEPNMSRQPSIFNQNLEENQNSTNNNLNIFENAKDQQDLFSNDDIFGQNQNDQLQIDDILLTQQEPLDFENNFNNQNQFKPVQENLQNDKQDINIFDNFLQNAESTPNEFNQQQENQIQTDLFQQQIQQEDDNPDIFNTFEENNQQNVIEQSPDIFDQLFIQEEPEQFEESQQTELSSEPFDSQFWNSTNEQQDTPFFFNQTEGVFQDQTLDDPFLNEQDDVDLFNQNPVENQDILQSQQDIEQQDSQNTQIAQDIQKQSQQLEQSQKNTFDDDGQQPVFLDFNQDVIAEQEQLQQEPNNDLDLPILEGQISQNQNSEIDQQDQNDFNIFQDTNENSNIQLTENQQSDFEQEMPFFSPQDRNLDQEEQILEQQSQNILNQEEIFDNDLQNQEILLEQQQNIDQDFLMPQDDMQQPPEIFSVNENDDQQIFLDQQDQNNMDLFLQPIQENQANVEVQTQQNRQINQPQTNQVEQLQNQIETQEEVLKQEDQQQNNQKTIQQEQDGLLKQNKIFVPLRNSVQENTFNPNQNQEQFFMSKQPIQIFNFNSSSQPIIKTQNIYIQNNYNGRTDYYLNYQLPRRDVKFIDIPSYDIDISVYFENNPFL